MAKQVASALCYPKTRTGKPKRNQPGCCSRQPAPHGSPGAAGGFHPTRRQPACQKENHQCENCKHNPAAPADGQTGEEL